MARVRTEVHCGWLRALCSMDAKPWQSRRCDRFRPAGHDLACQPTSFPADEPDAAAGSQAPRQQMRTGTGARQCGPVAMSTGHSRASRLLPVAGTAARARQRANCPPAQMRRSAPGMSLQTPCSADNRSPSGLARISAIMLRASFWSNDLGRMAGKPGNLLPQALVLSKFQRQHAGGQGRTFGKALWRKAIDFDVMRAIRLRSDTFDPFVLSKGFQEEIHLSNADVQPFGYLALGQARVDLQKVHNIEGEAIAPSLAWFMIVGLGQGDEGLV